MNMIKIFMKIELLNNMLKIKYHEFEILPHRELEYIFTKVLDSGVKIPQQKLITMVTNFSNFRIASSKFVFEYEILPPKTLEELFGKFLLHLHYLCKPQNLILQHMIIFVPILF